MRKSDPALSAEEIAALRAEAERLLTGPLSLEGNYLRFSDGPFNPEVGDSENEWTPRPARFVPTGFADRSGEDGRYEETERGAVWLMAPSQIPWMPELRDRLEVLGAVWEILRIETDPALAHWAFAARRA